MPFRGNRGIAAEACGEVRCALPGVPQIAAGRGQFFAIGRPTPAGTERPGTGLHALLRGTVIRPYVCKITRKPLKTRKANKYSLFAIFSVMVRWFANAGAC